MYKSIISYIIIYIYRYIYIYREVSICPFLSEPATQGILALVVASAVAPGAAFAAASSVFAAT